MGVRDEQALMKARTLLENLRRTPMNRGGRMGEPKRLLCRHIEEALIEHSVPERLAARMAFQFILKFNARDLGDQRVWSALGWLIHDEVRQLQEGLRLVDRLIRVALPKLSVPDIERLFQDMCQVDAPAGRSLAQAALTAADPVGTGRRYAAAFTRAVDRLKARDPRIARTLAAAVFSSRHPVDNALAYLERFHALVDEFQGDYTFARTVAREAFRASDPVRAAKQFVRDYRAIVKELGSDNLEPTIARSLAGIAALGAEPLQTARKLVDHFMQVEHWVKQSHPTIARSVALSACRASDPLAAARVYVENYDRIVAVIGAREPGRARRIAAQAFRTHDPLTWARRLREQMNAAS